MSDAAALLITLIVIFIFAYGLVKLITDFSIREKLQSKPSPEEASAMAKEIISNTSFLDTLDMAKSKWDFMDVVLYEDIRRLKDNQQLTESAIAQIINPSTLHPSLN